MRARQTAEHAAKNRRDPLHAFGIFARGDKYELAVAVSAKIEDDERAAIVEKVKAYVERFGGQITNVDEWGKRRLAYEVQHMKEAFYYFIQFESAPTAPAEIENRVRIMENVVRFLCVRQDEA